MTLNTQTPRVVITGNGTRGPYSLVDSTSQAIRFTSTSHVRLTRFAASTTDNDDGAVLVENTDYTVGGTEDARTFTLASGQAVLTSSQRILAERVQSYDQALDLTTGGAFNAASVEAKFDKVEERLQEIKAQIARFVPLQFADATVAAAFPSPPTSATKILVRTTAGAIAHADAADLPADLILFDGWDDILGNDPADAVAALGIDAYTLNTIADLQAATWTVGEAPDQVLIENYASGWVGGGGVWVLDASDSSSSDDGGAVIRTASLLRYKAQWSAEVDVCRFGMHPSATASVNRDAWQACEDYCEAQFGRSYGWSVMGRYSVAKRTSAPTDRAIIKRAGAKMIGPGAGVPTDAALISVTVEPNEDMTLLIGSESVQTAPCTISQASPAVFTQAGHGYTANKVIYLLTTDTILEPLEVMRPYYVQSTGLTTDTFQIAASPGGTSINTTTAGSGTHTVLQAVGGEHSCALEGINVYGGDDGYDVQVLCAVSLLDSDVKNITFQPGDPTKQIHGVALLANPSAAWVNSWEQVTAGGFTSGTCMAFFGSDSHLHRLYCSSGKILLALSSGSLLVDGQFEIGNNGGGSGTGEGTVIYLGVNAFGEEGFTKIEGRYIYCNDAIVFRDCENPVNWIGKIDCEFIANEGADIKIGENVLGGAVNGSFGFKGDAGDPHIAFHGASNTGWHVKGNFHEDYADAFDNLPADTVIDGVFDIGGTPTSVFRHGALNVTPSAITAGASIASDTDSTDDLGTSSIYWRVIYGDNLELRPSSSRTPAANGDVSIELTNNTTLTFKAKGDDATVRSGTVTLS